MHRWYFIVDGKYYSCLPGTGFVIRYGACVHLQNDKTIEENLREFFRSIVKFNLYDVKVSTKDAYESFVEKKETRML